MPKAVRKRSTSVLQDGVVIGSGTPLRAALGLWHKRVNMISGSIVLIYKRGSVPKSDLRAWAVELRLLADAMEKYVDAP